MSAEPVPDSPMFDDPALILEALPEQHRAQFRSEYTAAVDRARRPEEYRSLLELLRLWRLRAVAYRDPSFVARRDAARRRGPGDLRLEEVVTDLATRAGGAGQGDGAGSG